MINTIEIHQVDASGTQPYKIYFKDRNGKKVFAYHDDPDMFLDLRQKEQFFMGKYIFAVSESDIKELEKSINWPA